MTLRYGLLLTLLLALVPAPGAAAGAPAKSGSVSTHPRLAARRAGVAAHAGAPGKHAGTGTRARGGAGAGPRTLEDIHIEGEIPVPQVLFITARDQRRFLEFQHHRYLKTSREIGEATALPSWIAVTGSRAAANKERSR